MEPILTSPEELARELYEALKGLIKLSSTSCVGPWDVARTAIAKYEASITHPLDGQE